ncbi:LysR substrate-binding domain-containing protein [Streptomyces sp. LZ34]
MLELTDDGTAALRAAQPEIDRFNGELRAVQVAAGAGYSVLPRSLCHEHLASGALALLHDPDVPPLNTLFLVRRPGADANPDVVRVRDHLRRAARAW